MQGVFDDNGATRAADDREPNLANQFSSPAADRRSCDPFGRAADSRATLRGSLAFRTGTFLGTARHQPLMDGRWHRHTAVGQPALNS